MRVASWLVLFSASYSFAQITVRPTTAAPGPAPAPVTTVGPVPPPPRPTTVPTGTNVNPLPPTRTSASSEETVIVTEEPTSPALPVESGASGSGKTVAITLGVVVGCVVLSIIGVFVFRKLKLKPSHDFKERLNPKRFTFTRGGSSSEKTGDQDISLHSISSGSQRPAPAASLLSSAHSLGPQQYSQVYNSSPPNSGYYQQQMGGYHVATTAPPAQGYSNYYYSRY